MRLRITYYYNYYFEILRKIEEDEQSQTFRNFFFKFNEKFYNYMEYDDKGKLVNIRQPILLTESEKNELYSYLWLLEKSRDDKIAIYEMLQEQISIVQENVAESLKKKLD